MKIEDVIAVSRLMVAEQALNGRNALDYRRLPGAIEQYPRGLDRCPNLKRHICGLIAGTEKKRPGRKQRFTAYEIHEISIAYDIYMARLTASADRSWVNEADRSEIEGLTPSEAAALLAAKPYGGPNVSPKRILNALSRERSRLSWGNDGNDGDADDEQD
jgi:hypothetical protein